MAEKKKVSKDKIENSQFDLKEILGDIKTVVSEEKETLFKVREYKTIKLKKENLVTEGKKTYSLELARLNEKELENLVRKIVKSELKNFQLKNNSETLELEKTKPTRSTKKSPSIELLKKAELLSLSKINNLGLSSKNTKAEIIKVLKENKIKAL